MNPALVIMALLAAAPDVPAVEAPRTLLAHAARDGAATVASPPLLLGTTVSPAPRTRPGLLLLGGAAALAGVALTVPAVTHRGCALAGQCADGSQALVAGGLFLAGAVVLAAADGSGAAPGGASPGATGVSGAQLRERLGLDVPLGAPGPHRSTLRWSPFRLRRGGGVRVGLAF